MAGTSNDKKQRGRQVLCTGPTKPDCRCNTRHTVSLYLSVPPPRQAQRRNSEQLSLRDRGADSPGNPRGTQARTWQARHAKPACTASALQNLPCGPAAPQHTPRSRVCSPAALGQTSHSARPAKRHTVIRGEDLPYTRASRESRDSAVPRRTPGPNPSRAQCRRWSSEPRAQPPLTSLTAHLPVSLGSPRGPALSRPPKPTLPAPGCG